MLRAFVLALHDDARRDVSDADGRIRLVDVLAAGTRGAERVDAQLGGIDRQVLDLVEFRQDRNRARGGMDAALCFRRRHALHAVRARFELELRVRAFAHDAADDFPVAAVLASAFAQHFDLPALPLGIARIHAEEVAGENGGLVPARAGADFQEDVRVVARVLRDQQVREFETLRVDAVAQFAYFVGGQFAHLDVGARGHFFRGAQLTFEPGKLLEPLRDGLEPRILHGEIAELALLRDDIGVGEQCAHFLEALDRPFETASDRLFHQSCG